MTFINPPPQLNYSVSVIIPMYNVEKYIAETLDSLLNQTLQDFEVIIRLLARQFPRHCRELR